MRKSIEGNILAVRARIDEAARRAGRDPSRVRLLAATKNRTKEEVAAALSAGVDLVGENRVQEFLSKVDEVEGAEWHFIGHLQRNKVKYIVGQVALIHSVDSVSLAEELDRRSRGVGRGADVLLQVNVSGEESKQGFSVGELEEALRLISDLESVNVKGLSTMAPHEDAEKVRTVFRAVRELSEGLGLDSPELSMGMTNDYEVAVEEGSTIVRIGTAIFEHD
jgi:PLP dependent protein